MTAYVALLRGILPTNPNMRNEKLRSVFEGLGFARVQTVISSGNVLFESASKNTAKLESQIEKALFDTLGFHSTTIIRSRDEIAELVATDPFEGAVHSKKTSLNITFLKKSPTAKVALPRHEKGYTVLAQHSHALASIVDLTGAKTPDLMRWLEKEYGKEITTRTWKTVEKLLTKLDEY